MSNSIIEGDKFIEQESNNILALNPALEREEIEVLLNRVAYDKEVNTNYDFVYQESVVYDGTMSFIWDLRSEMFANLLMGRLVLEEDLGKDNLNISYKIGDVSFDTEKNTETNKPFPMSKYIIKIPIKIVK